MFHIITEVIPEHKKKQLKQLKQLKPLNKVLGTMVTNSVYLINLKIIHIVEKD